VTTGSYPARAGNRVELLIDGLPAFRRLCAVIDAARHSVWATITFLWPSFEMPDGRGPPLAVLEQAARRGIDVRLLFWRPDDATAALRRNAFWGSQAHLEQLRVDYPNLSVRWDRAPPGYCQHQKSWVIDAGEDGQTAFAGGLNLNPHSLASPGHAPESQGGESQGGEGQGGKSHTGGHQNHDMYLELTGPAVADVHDNFVQRWNEASERLADDGICGPRGGAPLRRAVRLPAETGAAVVQVQRTVPGGEQTILAQSLAALRAARQAIYIENQYLEVPEIVSELDAALRRGVDVVLVMPALPELAPDAYDAPDRRAFFAARASLGRFDNFTLAGLAGRTDDGRRVPVYVHSKLMIVDDSWASVGSCNFHRYSLFGNGELNVAIWCRDSARAFRTALFAEHLAEHTSKLEGREALRLFRAVARANRRRLADGTQDWQGLAFALDVGLYGKQKAF
jgi:phosphatidylserine/phosphatidylglycerophosphate/cardiolipin synthase-like enzyme